MIGKKFLIFMLILSALANAWWSFYFYPFYFPAYVNIPSPDQVNNFCQSKGYDHGWVSQNCGINEVQCHKKFFDLDKYVCVDWEAFG